MHAARSDKPPGAPGAKRPHRPPTTSPARNARARGSRTRCLPGSRERTWVAHVKSLVAAAVLAVPCLVFPTAPVDATDDKSRRIGHGEAECRGEDLMAGVRDAHGTLRGMRIGPWLDPEEGELAGISDIDRERWWDLTWDGFSHVADNDLTRTGSQEVTGGDLLLGRSFLFTAGFAAATDDRWLEWRQSAPMRSSGAHDAYGDGLIGLFGADGERDRLLAGVALSGSTKIRGVKLHLPKANVGKTCAASYLCLMSGCVR